MNGMFQRAREVSFVVAIGLVVAIVVGAFLFDIRHIPRPGKFDETGLKDCFGLVPKELKHLQISESRTVSVRAASSRTLDLQMIEVGKETSVWPRQNEMPLSAKSTTSARNLGSGKERYADYGFLALHVPDDGYYRVAAATKLRRVGIEKLSQPDIEIAPVHHGHIQCELDYVADYHLRSGDYVLQIFALTPKVRLVIAPAETPWDASWSRKARIPPPSRSVVINGDI